MVMHGDASDAVHRRCGIWRIWYILLGIRALHDHAVAPSHFPSLGFRVEGLGFRVEGLGLRVEG